VLYRWYNTYCLADSEKGVHLSSSRSSKPLLYAAGLLAEFAELDVAECDAFRQQNPDFAPAKWWDYEPDGISSLGPGLTKQWQLCQRHLRKAWTTLNTDDDGVDIFTLIKLLTLVFDPENLIDVMLGLPARPAMAELDEVDAYKWGYHKGVEFVAKEPWRAKVCEECGRKFVADHAKRKYCSVSGPDGVKCSAKVIKRTHLEWGRQNNWGRR
jgi:ribosomal protein S27AE